MSIITSVRGDDVSSVSKRSGGLRQLTFKVVRLREDQGIGEIDTGFLQVVHTMGMQKNLDIANANKY